MIAYAVRRLVAVAPSCLQDLLGAGRWLVPVPSSAPSPPHSPYSLWVPLRICEELVEQGLGAGLLPCLKRERYIGKNSYAATRRTPAEHYDSMTVSAPVIRPAQITLVDDVITQGATALAAASRLAEVFPESEIGVFALVRTRGLVEDIDSIVDPVSGWIVERQGRAWRDHD